MSFSDQDDVALRNKLSLAIKCLEKENQTKPLLFFSQMTYVNENLEKEGEPIINEKALGFANALFEGSVNGNLMVMNRKAIELFLSRKPKTFTMHDRWAYRCVSAFGKIVYSPISTLLYRQHSAIFSVPISGLRFHNALRMYYGLHPCICQGLQEILFYSLFAPFTI